MKTQLSFIGGLCLLLCATAQAQSGALDPSFNSNGFVVQPIGRDVVQKILVQDDQKILSIGMSWDGTFTAHAHVFRYNPDGSPDTDFGTNGMFTHTLDNEALLYSALITDAGKILLVGSTTDYQTYRLMLIQINADGTLDSSFGTNGVALQSVSMVGPNAEDMAYDVTLDDAGNILVCGSSYDANYVRRPVVVRFTSDGVLDSTFGVDGVATIPVMAVGASSFQGLLVQPDGKILATGYFGQTEFWYLLLLVRFNSDGSLDSTFSTDGIIKHNHGNVDDEGEDLKLNADGSILVAGMTVTATYNYSALLMKFTPDGEVDLTFGNVGAVEEDLDEFDYAAHLEVQSDGRIIMAGSSGVGPPSSFDMAVWKYMPDGTPDNSFGSNGLAYHVIPDYSTMIYALAMQADGKILIGGQAATPNNDRYFFTARLENDVISGIASVPSPTEALAFPNPATAGSLVTLRMAEPIGSDARIELYTADGRDAGSYSAHEFDRAAGGVSLQLPDGLNSGVYQVVLSQTGTRSTSTMLVIE
ncbi:MAG: hypothetical protein ABI599_11315 [Flavobacteriales bacterium]